MEPDFNHKFNGPNSPFSQEPDPPAPAPQKPNACATLSLVSGIFALISCCFPPLQLLLGASAIMLAVVSKKGKPFSGMAMAGLILGILSVICSILIFGIYAFTMQFLENPANAPLVKQILEEYQSLFDSFQAQ